MRVFCAHTWELVVNQGVCVCVCVVNSCLREYMGVCVLLVMGSGINGDACFLIGTWGPVEGGGG